MERVRTVRKNSSGERLFRINIPIGRWRRWRRKIRPKVTKKKRSSDLSRYFLLLLVCSNLGKLPFLIFQVRFPSLRLFFSFLFENKSLLSSIEILTSKKNQGFERKDFFQTRRGICTEVETRRHRISIFAPKHDDGWQLELCLTWYRHERHREEEREDVIGLYFSPHSLINFCHANGFDSSMFFQTNDDWSRSSYFQSFLFRSLQKQLVSRMFEGKVLLLFVIGKY